VLRTARAPYSKRLAQPCVPLGAFVGGSLDLVEALVYQVLCQKVRHDHSPFEPSKAMAR